MTGFKIPQIDQNLDKHILKVVCPQIRKSIIEIPIREEIENFSHFSSYVVNILGLDAQLKAILYNDYGCPYVNNLDLLLLPFPKIDFSQVQYIVFTKTPSSCDTLPQPILETKTNPQMIRIIKSSSINPLDIKFEIDPSNTVNVLKHKVYQLTKIHPSNQILKFSNTILSN